MITAISAGSSFKDVDDEKHLIALALLAAVMGGVQAQTTEGPWLLRLRAAHVENSNNTGFGLSVNDKTIPEMDVSYFSAKHGGRVEPDSAGALHHVFCGCKLGTFRQTPTTLMWQYHFTDMPGYKPYVGIGINHTLYSDANLRGLTLEAHSWGAALQAGMDIALDKNWMLNFALKKIYNRTDASGTVSGSLKLDPLMAGVGIGYRY